MKYCLLGKNVTKSFSKRIHSLLGSFPYELVSLPNENDFVKFIKEEDFIGANVTIPYKEVAYKNCDIVDMLANKLGVVNTLVKKDGKLYGYNTDAQGFIYMLNASKIDVFGRNCLVLGTGATSKTVEFGLRMLGAKSVNFLSRNPDYISSFDYSNKEVCEIAQVIVNTTPKGTPCLLDIDNCPNLESFIDVNYAPYRSDYLLKAYKKGIKTLNGLSMLVAQAVGSSSYFLDKEMDDSLTKDVYKQIKLDTSNIILVGHPFSGKTTIGSKLADTLKKEFIDLDEYIESKAKLSIPEIFSQKGEEFFRDLESECVKEIIEAKENVVLSTGGGVLKNSSNTDLLLSFGVLINLVRPLDLIKDEELSGRPLVKSRDDLKRLIDSREELYKIADYQIVNDKNVDQVVEEIKELL